MAMRSLCPACIAPTVAVYVDVFIPVEVCQEKCIVWVHSDVVHAMPITQWLLRCVLGAHAPKSNGA